MAQKEKHQNLAHATTLLVDSGPGAPVRGDTVTLDALTPPVSATPWHERLSTEEPGRYVEQTVLGAGGFGEVLAVYDTHLERSVALKQLHLREPSLMSALELRFVNEARITGKLEHPGIVPVYELGRRAADDVVYYVMRLVRGQSLLDALDGADLRARLRLLPHFVDACHAVAYAHSRGVVHRDLKPDNIMIGPFGQTLVVDWGLAKLRGEDDLGSQALAHGLAGLQGSSPALTIAGSAMGTPAYMPPEQCLGDLAAIDERSDVYALGAVLYHLITGQPPHVGPDARSILDATLTKPIVKPSSLEEECPPELEAIARRALRKRKNKRYENAEALANDVSAFLEGGIVGAHRYTATERLRRLLWRHRWGLVAASLVLGAAGASYLYRDHLGAERARAAREGRAAREAAAVAERQRVLGAELEVILDDTRRGTSQARWLETYSFRIVRLDEPVFRDELVRQLLVALVDPSPAVRRLAARSLGGIHNVDGVEPLAARLAEDGEEDPEVLVEIISALGIIGDARAEKPVADARYRLGQNSRLWEQTKLAYRMIPMPALEPGVELSADAWTNRGRAFVDKGHIQDALDAYNQALAMDPKLARALNNRALVLARRDLYDAALVDYDAALAASSDPEERDKTLYNRAVLKRKMEDYEGAIADYGAIVASSDKLRPIALRARANAYRYVGHSELAMADFQRGIELSPTDPKNHFGVGDLHAELGDYRAALAAFDRALSFNPQYLEARVQRGHCHRMLGEPLLSLSDFAQALDIDPVHDGARVNRASLLMERGDEKAALADLDYCLENKCADESLVWFRHAARAVLAHAPAGRWALALTDLEQAALVVADRSDAVLVALYGLAVARRLGPEARGVWLARAKPEPPRWWHERLLRVAAGELEAAAIADYVPRSRRCDVWLAAGLREEARGDRDAAAVHYRRAETAALPADLSCALATLLGRP